MPKMADYDQHCPGNRACGTFASQTRPDMTELWFKKAAIIEHNISDAFGECPIAAQRSPTGGLTDAWHAWPGMYNNNNNKKKSNSNHNNNNNNNDNNNNNHHKHKHKQNNNKNNNKTRNGHDAHPAGLLGPCHVLP